MAKEKIVYQKMITPKGTLIYPWLTKADTKFNPDGEYRTTFAVPQEAAESFCSKLDQILDSFYKEQVANAKNPAEAKKIKKAEPYTPQYDDNGDETGNVIFKMKLKALVKMKDGSEYAQKPKLFDAQGNPLPAKVNPYGGTQAKISVQVVPYLMPATKECGLSLRLQAVQVLQLVAGGGGGDADSFGFGKEDGYVADEEETFESAVADSEEDF